MRFLYLLILGLVTGGSAVGGPPVGPAPHTPAQAPAAKIPPGKVKVFQTEQTHPDNDVNLAIGFLEKVPADARCYWLFFSLDEVAPEYLARFTTTWRVYLNTVSSSQGLVTGVEVPGSNGRLYAVDIREPRWTIDAVRAVARRDVRYREPHVDPRRAKVLRDLAGIPQDPKTFQVGNIVPALWFVREVMEADRSTTYYDLLYARERFGDYVEKGPAPVEPKPRPWPGGYCTGSQNRAPGDYKKGEFNYIPTAEWNAYLRAKDEYDAKAGDKVVRDFPATTQDFEKKWGATAALDFLKKEYLRTANGEVVAGARSDPVHGSYVAYQDRVVYMLQTTLGVYLRTFDSLKTAGKKNYANNPKGVLAGDLEFDAGELLATLPNGLQAALLVNGQGKRVEIADSRIARNTKDPSDVTVRTQFSCVTCHAPQGGVLNLSNKKITEAIARGNRQLQKDPDVRKDLEAFLKGVDVNVPVWRVKYQFAVAQLTTTQATPKGWTGQELAAETLFFRDWYDAPVTLPEAAAELGYPPVAVILAALVEGSIDAGNLVLASGVPRTVWDDDLFVRLSLILSAAKAGETGDPLLDYWIGPLLEDALRKPPK